jgi:hypothetical protein
MVTIFPFVITKSAGSGFLAQPEVDTISPMIKAMK